MLSDFLKHAPIATLAGQCYFCRAKTPFIYKGGRICHSHATAEVLAIIDVQNPHLTEESRQVRKVLNYYT